MPATATIRRRARTAQFIRNDPGPAPVVYNDSGSGTFSLSGTRIESLAHSGSGAGSVPLSGARTESQAHSGPPVPSVGRIPLTGSATDEYLPPGGVGNPYTRPTMGAGT